MLHWGCSQEFERSLKEKLRLPESASKWCSSDMFWKLCPIHQNWSPSVLSESWLPRLGLLAVKLNSQKKKTCASPSRLPKNTLVVSIGSLVRFITSARVVRIGLHLFCLGFHLSRLGYWSWYCWAFWQSNESHGLTWA